MRLVALHRHFIGLQQGKRWLLLLQPIPKQTQITAVSGQGVAGQSVFQPECVNKRIYGVGHGGIMPQPVPAPKPRVRAPPHRNAGCAAATPA